MPLAECQPVTRPEEMSDNAGNGGKEGNKMKLRVKDRRLAECKWEEGDDIAFSVQEYLLRIIRSLKKP